MARFTKLIQDSFQRLAPLPHQEIFLPASYAKPVGLNGQEQTIMYNRFVRIGELGEVRSVCLQAPKIDIVNMFFFPQPSWHLPVFAMELVVLGTRPVVGVIDLLSLLPELSCQEPARKILIQTHADFPQLRQSDDPPLWYQACRSGLDFFVRPQEEDDLTALGLAHLQVWEGLLTLLQAPRPLDNDIISVHRQNITAYKHHHRDNTPGLRLLQQCFGPEWTAQYLSEYLFI